MQTRLIVILGVIFFMMTNAATLGQTINYDYGYKSRLVQQAENYHGMTNLPYLAAMIMPGVVTIHAYSKNSISQGSGFFITPQDVITCNHVVNVANLDHITVELYVPIGVFGVGPLLPSQLAIPGMSVYPATIAEENASFDVARLHLQSPVAKGLNLLVNYSYPLVGEDVAVFGSPESKYFTVTRGIVSGFRYPSETAAVLNKKTGQATPISPEFGNVNQFAVISGAFKNPLYIQFDAASSHGTSGGPLVNSKGEVIGIDDRFYPYENSENLNFAIPSLYFAVVMRELVGTSQPGNSYSPQQNQPRSLYSPQQNQPRSLYSP